MKYIVLLIFNLFLFTKSLGQANLDSLISIGSKHTLYSATLHEKRDYWVHLPSGYSKIKYLPVNYPVIYLLDGDFNFHSFTGLCQFLGNGPYALIPEAIVIGIPNLNRTRDLTPTKSSLTDYYDNNKQLYTESGGNEDFIDFLKSELMPEIEKRYRTLPYKVLVGHSFGGLTAVNILLNHTALFNAYLCIDPSLWWDNDVMARQAVIAFSNTDFLKRSIFISQAYKSVTPEDTTTNMTRSAARFHQLLQKRKPRSLRWKWQFYKNEDHGTVPVPSEWDGLKFLFAGYQIPVKQVLNEPDKLLRNYSIFSKNQGFSFQPSEALLDMLGTYAASINKTENALRFYQIALSLYPKSKVAIEAIGKIKNQRRTK